MDVRPFHPFDGERWLGDAVCYGPHRDGQRPGGPDPSVDEIREDLRLMRPHWRLIRLYGATGVSETILATIRADSPGMKVMLGAWIDVAKPADDDREVAAAIRLANAYPDVVIAVCVGNETQVSWSDHRCPPDSLIARVREVRKAVTVPVTTADDFGWWVQPESRVVARELDFITLHAHPLWNGRTLAEALPWLEEQVVAVADVHPGAALVLGETGWATDHGTDGDQGRLIRGRTDEASQAEFYRGYREWVETSRTPSFWFEAFDENWKGGADPHEIEKHWGLFRADRTPKPALAAD